MFAKVLGGVGRSLMTAGTLILLFVAYQLWGTGLQEARSQEKLRDEFSQTIQEVETTTTSTSTTTTVAPDPGDGDGDGEGDGRVPVDPTAPVEPMADLPLPKPGAVLKVMSPKLRAPPMPPPPPPSPI